MKHSMAERGRYSSSAVRYFFADWRSQGGLDEKRWLTAKTAEGGIGSFENGEAKH
jgi:hypothetical protein